MANVYPNAKVAGIEIAMDHATIQAPLPLLLGLHHTTQLMNGQPRIRILVPIPRTHPPIPAHIPVTIPARIPLMIPARILLTPARIQARTLLQPHRPTIEYNFCFGRTWCKLCWRSKNQSSSIFFPMVTFAFKFALLLKILILLVTFTA